MQDIYFKQPTPEEQQRMHEEFMSFLRTNPNNFSYWFPHIEKIADNDEISVPKSIIIPVPEELYKAFFQENITDLSAYFKITDVYQAVMETLQEAKVLQCLMLDISPQANLDVLFRHLENSRYSEMSLGKEKVKGNGLGYRPSWLRIYAIKMDKGAYLITGGAIKLTATMSERPHTLAELAQLEKVRNKLIDLGVYDIEGLNDYNNEQNN